VSVRTFVIPFYYGSGTVIVTGTVLDYGSGSAKAKYGSYDSKNIKILKKLIKSKEQTVGSSLENKHPGALVEGQHLPLHLLQHRQVI
jgi:hypothetical protein